jgi:outer membrane protein OmpA-like peptidoglycan-associated protein
MESLLSRISLIYTFILQGKFIMNKMSKVTASMLAGSLALLLPTFAYADNNSFSLKLEPGVAVPLTSPQSNRFDAGGAIAAQGLVSLTPWFALGPVVSVVALPSNLNGIDTGVAWGAGLGAVVRRSHDNDDTGLMANSAWLGTDFQMVKTGDLLRPAVSVAAGIHFPTSESRSLWVGPFLRLQNVFPTNSDPTLDSRDAKVAIIGLSFEFGGSRNTTESDRDGDGVPDSVDRCPDVPGPKANDGCPWPKVEAPSVPNHTTADVHQQPFNLEIHHKIQFDYDSAVLRSNSIPALTEVMQALLAHSNYKVRIEGHASAEGNAQHNQVLSFHRAQSVLEYLVAKGIVRDRLSAVGFGSSKPIASNATPVGRETNRRVEFEVTLTISADGESK